MTLLNTDNKLYGKLLANRLNHVLQNIIHFLQTGFVKGRLAAENIIKIMEILNYCNKEKVDGLLINFDFEKAFDTIEWEVIITSLAPFNFGPRFIEMILALFMDPLICASNNGYWSEFWSPTCGCHQGCTFSPVIFTTTVEILGLALRQNNRMIK